MNKFIKFSFLILKKKRTHKSIYLSAFLVDFFSAGTARTFCPFNKALARLKAKVFKSLRYLVFLKVVRILDKTLRDPDAFLNVTLFKFLAGLFRAEIINNNLGFNLIYGTQKLTALKQNMLFIPVCFLVDKTRPFLSADRLIPTVFSLTNPLNLKLFLPFKFPASFRPKFTNIY